MLQSGKGLACDLGLTGLLSNQGEKSINSYFIRVPLIKKSIQVWYSKAQLIRALRLEFGVWDSGA